MERCDLATIIKVRVKFIETLAQEVCSLHASLSTFPSAERNDLEDRQDAPEHDSAAKRPIVPQRATDDRPRHHWSFFEASGEYLPAETADVECADDAERDALGAPLFQLNVKYYQRNCASEYALVIANQSVLSEGAARARTDAACKFVREFLASRSSPDIEKFIAAIKNGFKRKVIWDVSYRFCRKERRPGLQRPFSDNRATRVDRPENGSIVCDGVISGDEIKRRGNLRCGCLGLGSGLLHPHERNVVWSSPLDHREWE